MGLWVPFVWAAVIAAATAGFGYGTALFVASALGAASPSWWAATAQAHGHLQLFGWGGLMVLGVGFFFLPRLRGAALAGSELLRWVLGLMAGGLALRAVSQPARALSSGSAASVGLVASGLLELGAATLAVGMLVATFRKGPPLWQRPGLAPVLPYLLVGFICLWLAMAANAVLTLAAAGQGVVPSAGDALVVRLGLEGFLVPVSVAVSARSFPLFLWLRVPSSLALRLALAPFVGGLILRCWESAGGPVSAAQFGALLEGAALVSFAVILGVVPTRRREGVKPSEDRHYLKPVEYLLVPAYVWLAVAGVLQVVSGMSMFGIQAPGFVDAERHALGSGFVTLLIFGMGQRMLPGFAGRQIASTALVWWTVILGNASAILRVVPLLTASAGVVWPAGSLSAAQAFAGVLGITAVASFAANMWRTFR